MNMRDVARRAGVSSATVSRVLNGSPLVQEETARHVRSVLEELNFIPNPVATTLKYGRSGTYGLLIPDIMNPFYAEIIHHFEALLVERDQELLLASTGTRESAVMHSVRRMLMRQVDGVVLMASEVDTKAIEPLLARRVPLVTVDRRTVQEGISDVAIDFEAGIYAAVEHLQGEGHRRLAFVGGSKGLRTSAVRLKAFQLALKRWGLPFDPELALAGDYRVSGGEAAARLLLDMPSPPTAILTANDLTAFGVIRTLHRAGLNVPRDMSVVGMDDILLCDFLEPALTSVHFSRRQIAESCMRALDALKEQSGKRGKRYTVESSLTVRDSTVPPGTQMHASTSGVP